MSVSIESTPNPNAMKFTVGIPVGGPSTFSPVTAAENPLAAALFDIDDVASVFMTADFVTVTKAPDGNWDDIAQAAKTILETHFG